MYQHSYTALIHNWFVQHCNHIAVCIDLLVGHILNEVTFGVIFSVFPFSHSPKIGNRDRELKMGGKARQYVALIRLVHFDHICELVQLAIQKEKKGLFNHRACRNSPPMVDLKFVAVEIAREQKAASTTLAQTLLLTST